MVFVAVGSRVLVGAGVGGAADVEQATDTKINSKIKDKKGFRVLRCIYPPHVVYCRNPNVVSSAYLDRTDYHPFGFVLMKSEDKNHLST
jgi:hypothetical protein